MLTDLHTRPVLCQRDKSVRAGIGDCEAPAQYTTAEVRLRGERGLERLRAWCPTRREPSGLLPTRRWSPPCGQAGTIGATEYQVILGHATSVPFTAVLIGTQRTATDNADASSTCAVLSSRRSES
jgi:hypothetical protein